MEKFFDAMKNFHETNEEYNAGAATLAALKASEKKAIAEFYKLPAGLEDELTKIPDANARDTYRQRLLSEVSYLLDEGTDEGVDKSQKALYLGVLQTRFDIDEHERQRRRADFSTKTTLLLSPSVQPPSPSNSAPSGLSYPHSPALSQLRDVLDGCKLQNFMS